MRAAVFVHIASLMFWLGALLPLLVMLRGNDNAALSRFSRFIPWVIGTLLLGFELLAQVQLAGFRTLQQRPRVVPHQDVPQHAGHQQQHSGTPTASSQSNNSSDHHSGQKQDKNNDN